MAVLDDRIEHEIVIAAQPELVFEFFTVSDRYPRWLGLEGDPRVPPGSSTVTVTLERVDAGTRLRLVHTGLPHPSLAAHDTGWHGYLSQLAGAAEG